LVDTRVHRKINRSLDCRAGPAVAGFAPVRRFSKEGGEVRGFVLLALVAALAVAALATAPPAQAACKVTPNRPIIRADGGGEFTVWGWAYVSGCGKGTHVRIYLCELLGSKWWCGNRLVYAGPLENANYPSGKVPIDCAGYGGSGKIATGWSFDGGKTKHVGTGKLSWVCQ
jgi:hypothetical protein